MRSYGDRNYYHRELCRENRSSSRSRLQCPHQRNRSALLENHTRQRDSIATGSVPQDWRIANVVPIFKKGSKSEPGNYRPWFEVYATYVRPVLTTGRQIISNFFVTTSRKVVVNPSTALRQYHDRYTLPNITSQIIRRVCETWTLSRYSDSKKRLFAHTNDKAKRVYREKTLTDMCHAHELVVNSGKADEADCQPPMI
ncbi:unnamed protein product [Ranitomeya imitator]|uniref:Ribosomal protein S7 n=1 Tax=Ranitomeya imitator TaxID=111125 RepID=A0ABN9LP41_9NEOB|nr:unnamed protein product [Ranitomeya imitator]